jgi:hypothetical protein
VIDRHQVVFATDPALQGPGGVFPAIELLCEGSRAPARPRAASPAVASPAWIACALALSMTATANAAATTWSAPAPLPSCVGPGAPRVAFPQSNPYTRTGAGAIAWGGVPSACPAGEIAATGIAVAALGADDRPGRPAALRAAGDQRGLTGALIGPTAVGATCGGGIVIAAGRPATSGGGLDGVVVEGDPGKRFRAPVALDGPATPVAVARAYRGDVAVASVRSGVGGRGRAVALRIQPYNATQFRPAITVASGSGQVDAVAAALDFRADALVVWHQGASVYARERLQPGRLGPVQRLGSSGASPVVQPLISDNGRAIVAWADTRPGAGGTTTTRVALAVSRFHHRFEPAHLLERYTNLPGVVPGAGAVRLARLSTETVMLAWTGMSRGRYVVRVAPVSVDAIPRGHVVSGVHADALLADVATGPHGQALAMWTSAPRTSGGFDTRHQAIIAARGDIVHPFRARFQAPEPVAAAGPNANPSVAYDPSSNRAVAVWQTRGRPAGVDFAVREAGANARPRVAAAATECPALVGHPFRRAVEIAVGALAAAALLAFVAWRLVARRRSVPG